MSIEYLRICLAAALILQSWFFVGLVFGAHFFKGTASEQSAAAKRRIMREREEKRARIWENIENYATDTEQKEV